MRTHRTVALAVIFAAGFIVWAPTPAGSEEQFQSRATILFGQAHPSIVYIQASNAKESASCTGSIVASTATGSTIMTAAHCVAGMSTFLVILREDVSKPYAATVLKAGTESGSDVAFLHIGVGRQPILRVATSVDVGANVVIIGYPRAALSDFKERHILVARQDQTAIASVVPRANNQPQIINYQYAVTDHGDSGAPVIEVECGCIVGVVHGEYAETEARSDYAMGPQEIFAVAGGSAPQIALTRVGGPPAKAAPVAVAYTPPKAVATRAPVTSVSPRVESLNTVPGPPGTLQWTGWGTAIVPSEIPLFYTQVRCLTIGREQLWQAQVINEGPRQVSFLHRLTDASGNAYDGFIAHSIDNNGAYLFRPQQLDVSCTGGTAYHHITNVSYVGNAKTPQKANLIATSGGPKVTFSPWGKWSASGSLHNVQIDFRCLELGDNWFGWEVAFQNKSGKAITFDFDVEASGGTANYRHRYQLPAATANFYSDAIPLLANCKSDVEMWSRPI